MASKRRHMSHKNKTQETTEKGKWHKRDEAGSGSQDQHLFKESGGSEGWVPDGYVQALAMAERGYVVRETDAMLPQERGHRLSVGSFSRGTGAADTGGTPSRTTTEDGTKCRKRAVAGWRTAGDSGSSRGEQTGPRQCLQSTGALLHHAPKPTHTR
ncbi:hypothetical protein AAG570_001719 [Ranatra chinensis]|uniref:Uncharacterized protein n=1 Tax=Ranatra chinensis TaxID=642074 RepID=A0ABD0YBA3_9HEMI